jgi:hypothetical protein
MTLTAGRRVSNTPVNDPVIVKDDTFTGIQTEPHHVFLVAHHLPKPAEGRVIGVQRLLRQVEYVLVVLADRDARDVSIVVELNHMLARAHVERVVLAVIGNIGFHQQLEVVRIGGSEILGNRQTVDKNAVTPLNRIRPAVQILDAWCEFFGRQIRVQRQGLGREGKVRWLDVGFHLERMPEVAGPHISEQAGEISQPLIRIRHAGDQRNAIGQHRSGPGLARISVRCD